MYDYLIKNGYFLSHPLWESLGGQEHCLCSSLHPKHRWIHFIDLRMNRNGKIFQNLRYASFFDGASKEGIVNFLVANYYQEEEESVSKIILLQTWSIFPASFYRNHLWCQGGTHFEDLSSFLRRSITPCTAVSPDLAPLPSFPEQQLYYLIAQERQSENSVSCHSFTGCHSINITSQSLSQLAPHLVLKTTLWDK